LGKGQDAIKRALPIVEAIDEKFFGALFDTEDFFRNCLHKLIDSDNT
jgi:hypothetical protein